LILNIRKSGETRKYIRINSEIKEPSNLPYPLNKKKKREKVVTDINKKKKAKRSLFKDIVFSIHCISIRLDLNGDSDYLKKNILKKRKKEIADKFGFAPSFVLIFNIIRLYCNFFEDVK
jgi:hypothetical protein